MSELTIDITKLTQEQRDKMLRGNYTGQQGEDHFNYDLYQGVSGYESAQGLYNGRQLPDAVRYIPVRNLTEIQKNNLRSIGIDISVIMANRPRGQS